MWALASLPVSRFPTAVIVPGLGFLPTLGEDACCAHAGVSLGLGTPLGQALRGLGTAAKSVSLISHGAMLKGTGEVISVMPLPQACTVP